MEWLNYHHLLYFWTVARAGSVVKAAEELRLSQPAVSGQVTLLEEALGEELLVKQGRNLVLTEVGREVFRYADEIFTLGRELRQAIRGEPTRGPKRLSVGLADAVPKLVARRLLEPAVRASEPVRLMVREGTHERLLADLAIHTLDLVITDAPIGPMVNVRGFNHLLGECGTTFFAMPSLAKALKGKFPKNLDAAPMLLPLEGSTARRELDRWFDAQAIRPVPAGEFEDSALMTVFGENGSGVFAAPSVIEKDVRRQLGAVVVGRTDEIRGRFYAITAERKLQHPAVIAISEAAREKLFG